MFGAMTSKDRLVGMVWMLRDASCKLSYRTEQLNEAKKKFEDALAELAAAKQMQLKADGYYKWMEARLHHELVADGLPGIKTNNKENCYG